MNAVVQNGGYSVSDNVYRFLMLLLMVVIVLQLSEIYGVVQALLDKALYG